MAGVIYSTVTVFGVIMIAVALALQLLYIQVGQTSENYIAFELSSMVINTAVVSYLLYILMFYRPYSSPAATGAAVFLLLFGLGAEIYMNQFEASIGVDTVEYMLVAFNAIYRLYLLIQVRCESALTTIPELVDQVVKVAKATNQPVADISRQVGADLKTMDVQNLYQNISSNLGSILSDLPAEKKDEIKGTIRKAMGIAPKVTTAGRRR